MKTARTRSMAGNLALISAMLAPFVFFACNNSSFYTALGNKATVGKLSISPVSATVPVNGTVTFSATGGVPPYTFLLLSGPGAIASATGVYTASATAGAVSVEVKDVQGSTNTASITVTSSAGPLTLTPTSVSMNVSGSLTFVATGGTPPYAFSIQTAGSGTPTVGATTGTYTTGASTGSDVVKVTDGTGLTSTSTVAVTTATTGVDNQIASEALPISGTGGTALPAGYSFVIKNAGTANGTQAISWWVFLSPTSPTPGSGTVLLASGTTAALGAGVSSAPIALSWTWPSVPPVLPGPTRYIYIMISAADDLTTSNNSFMSGGLVVAPPNVDYTVSSVANTGGLVAASGLTGSFTLSNAGTANGGQTVSWTAYISTNSTAIIDASCVVLDSGTTGPLIAGGSQAVGFTGQWPATTGTYYLKVAVSAGDDINTANNSGVSSVSYVTTSVDYTVTAVTNTGGAVAGAALSGNFTLQNAGTANGGQTVSWTVYASTSTTIGAGSTVVASGTSSPLGSGVSAAVPFAGSWPATPGTYYLIAAVSAADDVNSANNSLTGAAIPVTAASVDYAVASVTYTGGVLNPAGTVNGSFQLANIGANNGTQYVTWQAYASTTATPTSSSVLVAFGTVAPMAAGAPSTPITFSGAWPLNYGNYYLVVTATVPVDVDSNPANNVGATASTTAVGFYNEDSDEPANNSTSTPYNLGVSMQPGMSICVTGSMPLLDSWDIVEINTGTAVSLSLSWTWATSTNVGLYVANTAGTILSGFTISGSTTLSMFWTVDLQNTAREIGMNAASAIPPGTQTLIITAH